MNLENSTDLIKRYNDGDVSAVNGIIEILKSNNISEKYNIYNNIDGNIRDALLLRTIYDDFKDTESGKVAIQFSANNKTKGYIKEFENYVINGNTANIGRIIYWLGKDGSEKSALEIVSESIKAGKIDLIKEYDVLEGMKYYAEKGNKDVQILVYETALTIYNKNYIDKAKYDEMEWAYSSTNPATSVLDILLTYGDERSIPVAKMMLKNNMLWIKAIELLVRLEGETHRGYILKCLENSETHYQGIHGASELYRKTKDKSIPKEILLHIEKSDEIRDIVINEIVSYFKKMRVTYLFDELDTFLKNDDFKNRITSSYNVLNQTSRDVANYLYKIGIVDEPFPKTVLEKANRNKKDDGDYAFIFNFLDVSGLYLSFDAEADEYPVNYQKLGKYFIANSMGKLRNARIVSHFKGLPDIKKCGYLIEFEIDGKKYERTISDQGDWYNLDEFVTFLNFILEDNNFKESYIAIPTGDQIVSYMFGPEDKIKQFIKKYQL